MCEGNQQSRQLIDNIIQCIIEAAQDPILSLCFDYRNIVSERTNNIPLIDYIVENGKINESEASYVISAISDIINYGITEETFFSKILYASNENRCFWPLVVDYAVSMDFCSNKLDFANKFREYQDKYNVPNACIGQRSAPSVNIQSFGYSVTPDARKKIAEGIENSKDITNEENDRRYKGNTGLVIRNGFKYDENTGVVTPTVVFENGDSVISKEGIAEIESMGENSKGTEIEVVSGMQQIIVDNIGTAEEQQVFIEDQDSGRSFEDNISSWLPEMREIDEFSKGLLRRVINMCEKDGKKIQDITTSDISEKIIEYINKRDFSKNCVTNQIK